LQVGYDVDLRSGRYLFNPGFRNKILAQDPEFGPAVELVSRFFIFQRFQRINIHFCKYRSGGEEKVILLVVFLQRARDSFPIPFGDQSFRVNTAFDQVVDNGFSPSLGKDVIVFFRGAVIGMGGQFNDDRRILVECLNQSLQRILVLGQQLPPVEFV